MMCDGAWGCRSRSDRACGVPVDDRQIPGGPASWAPRCLRQGPRRPWTSHGSRQGTRSAQRRRARHGSRGQEREAEDHGRATRAHVPLLAAIPMGPPRSPPDGMRRRLATGRATRTPPRRCGSTSLDTKRGSGRSVGPDNGPDRCRGEAFTPPPGVEWRGLCVPQQPSGGATG